MVEHAHSAGPRSGRGAGWWPQLYEPLKQFGERVADWFAPCSEASAVNDYYEISMELPGVKPDDIEVSLHDNQLTVKGEKRFAREEKGRSYFFSEREYGAFERSFRLPPDAAKEDIAAEFENGVLQLRVAKAGPAPDKTKKIEIRAR